MNKCTDINIVEVIIIIIIVVVIFQPSVSKIPRDLEKISKK